MEALGHWSARGRLLLRILGDIGIGLQCATAEPLTILTLHCWPVDGFIYQNHSSCTMTALAREATRL